MYIHLDREFFHFAYDMREAKIEGTDTTCHIYTTTCIRYMTYI